MKSIAIMQPTFFPWVGYYALADRVDEFVILNNVQFDKRSWQQRNKIKTPQGPKFLTVPVKSKGKSDQLIKDVEILREGDRNPLKKILSSIEQNYRHSSYFSEFIDDIVTLLDTPHSNLLKLNMAILKWSWDVLEIKTPVTEASALAVTGSKDELLVNICIDRGAEVYFSPPGSKIYLEHSEAFHHADIEIFYHEYQHPAYSQLHGIFEPHMCILDLILNEGENSLEIIRSGILRS